MRTLILALLATYTLTASGAEVVRVAPWELHSSFWMSLHQTLIADAMRSTPRDLGSWTAEEQKVWNAAVAAYRLAGRGHEDDLTFATPMVITNDGLTQVADDAVDPSIDAPLAQTLKDAAAVYRAHGWADDDRANRFFIAYAAAMLHDAGAELIRQHEAVYRTSWPKHILVYVSPQAGPFGAYTMSGQAGGVITTMSCRDAGYQGLRALEMLLHESSHAIVSPFRGTIGSAIAASSKRLGVPVPRDLWHAVLFATSGELTRRLLVDRGAADYVASSEDLFTRAWPRYRKPVEKHWYAYLNGEGTLEQAIDGIVADIPR
jgi:hypothetical protein